MGQRRRTRGIASALVEEVVEHTRERGIDFAGQELDLAHGELIYRFRRVTVVPARREGDNT